MKSSVTNICQEWKATDKQKLLEKENQYPDDLQVDSQEMERQLVLGVPRESEMANSVIQACRFKTTTKKKKKFLRVTTS